MKLPELSIILPVHNGMPYLMASVHSVLSILPEHSELVISDDGSVDGSREFLSSIAHPRVRFAFSADDFSMSEHWDWAQTHAAGRWQMFLGQDDLLMENFFVDSKAAIEEAEEKGCETIAFSRSFVFWEGLDDAYEGLRAIYRHSNAVHERRMWKSTALALLNVKSYHQMPQMYTSSLFSADLIQRVREKQEGALFTCHPQDANLAAIAARETATYLFVGTPVSWVGTSPKSAGLAIVSATSSPSDTGENNPGKILANKYERSIIASGKIKYPSYAGPFTLGENSIYFWQAMVETSHLGGKPRGTWLQAKLVVWVIFLAVLSRIANDSLTPTKVALLEDFARKNSLDLPLLLIFRRLTRGMVSAGLRLRKFLRQLKKKDGAELIPLAHSGFVVTVSEMPSLDLDDLSSRIRRLKNLKPSR